MQTATIDLSGIFEALPNLERNERALIESAFGRASAAHADQLRRSGAPYIQHCVAVAEILADLGLDATTIAAALLHDVVEDTDVTLQNVRQEFGPKIAELVDGVTKLQQLSIEIDEKGGKNSDREMEYLRKMFLAMGSDFRVILIKLADRLHNMRTLSHMPPDRQLIKAKEALEIYAPIANRLGIWQLKWELEDLALRT
jgi:GTP pyrophosphokinase